MLIPSSTPPVIRGALAACRPYFVGAAVLSALGNVLYLTPTLFMLQVYDRVVPTAGLMTLLLLGLIALWAYATLGAFEWLRSRILVKAGARLDRELATPVLESVLSSDRMSPVARAEAMRELDTFRQAVAGPIMTMIFDAPWSPIYVAAAFLLNPWLGVLTLVAGAVLLGLAYLNERATGAPLARANDMASASYARQNSLIAHAAEVRALGMRRVLGRRALADRATAAAVQLDATFSGAGLAQITKTTRMTLQSVALALGAVLAIENKISSGAIIATSLLMSRALSPIEQLTYSWKMVIRARGAFGHLCALLNTPVTLPATVLPRPSGRIEVEDLHVVAPGTDRLVIAGVSFQVAPGELIGVAGLSGAGKSSLLAALAGAQPAVRGGIRFDGARLDSWDPERLAGHVGYLPQDFSLFAGTVKENIARFSVDPNGDTEALDAKVIAAAQAAGAHDMIVRLPAGYDTPVGQAGVGLSAGQTQRVALARAMFGEPAILLLDEPYSFLDNEGQVALVHLMQRARGRTTIVFTAHRPDILSLADKALVMAGGRVVRFQPMKAPAAGGAQVHSIEEKRA